MEGLQGEPEGGQGSGVELEEFGQLTGLFPSSPCGTVGETGDDGTWHETCHNHLRGGDILAIESQILDILGLHWWLVGNSVAF